jgi:hypothetical protein
LTKKQEIVFIEVNFFNHVMPKHISTTEVGM